MGRNRDNACQCVLPVTVSPIQGGCPGAAVGGYGGCPGAVGGYGGCPGVVGGYGGCGCFAPVANCARGLCFENGEVLIAAVLLLLGLGVFNGHGGPGISSILGAVKALQ